MKRSGFTLIELLLVIAVIGILSGLLFTGVLGLVGQARNAANDDNATILQAAIMEYWHEQGRWPIPKNHKPGKVNARTIYQEDGSGNQEQTGTEVYAYKLVYGAVSNGSVMNNASGCERGNNSLVVKELFDVQVGKRSSAKKDYLDLTPFITVEDGANGDEGYPVEDVRTARGLKSEAKSGKVPLLYRAKFFKCPNCEKRYVKTGGRRTCDNRACQYYKQQGKFYRFQKNDETEGAQPYVITFDFLNNKCSVKTQ